MATPTSAPIGHFRLIYVPYGDRHCRERFKKSSGLAWVIP